MTLAAVLASRRTRRTLRPEYVLTSGPLVLGQPGAGTFAELYGGAWALLLTSGGPQLMQLQGGAWVARADGAALSALIDGVAHVALAFDQAARPVVAWQSGGNVYVRQWDGQSYVTRGPFLGTDPLLLCDALIMFQPQISDVILCHLSPERDRVLTRTQREGYAVPRVAATVPSGTVLDQAVPYPYSWAALGEADGAALNLRSGLYPVNLSSRGAASVSGLTGGEFRPSVVISSLGPDVTAGSLTGLSGGVWASPVMRGEGESSAVGSLTGLGGGAFLPSAVQISSSNTMSSSVSGLTGGAFKAVVIVTTSTPNAAQSSMSGLSGGFWNV